MAINARAGGRSGTRDTQAVAAAPPSHYKQESAGGTFASLGISAYRILWLGTLFSFLGMQMQMIARGYLAYELTGKNTALGGVMIAFGIPQLLFGLHGGVVADRFAKRSVLIVWQMAIALASLAMAVVIETGHVQYWMLLATGVVTGLSFAFIGPARQAFIGDLVPPNMLGNAIVLQQANMNGTRVFGPALAGAMIATPMIGIAGVYLVTTIGFVIATVTMLWLPKGLPNANARRRSPTQDTLDGLRFTWRTKPVLILVSMSFFVVMLGFPYQGFLASVAKSEFGQGATGLGWMSSVAAVGALAATLWAASLTASKRVWQIQTVAGIIFGASLVAFAASPNFVTGLATIFVIGAAASAFQALNNALTMMLTERAYYGRIQAIMSMSWSMFGIISLPLGIVADIIGIRETLAIMGVLSVISIIVLQVVARMMGLGSTGRAPRDAEPSAA